MSTLGDVGTVLQIMEEAKPLIESLFSLWMAQGKDPRVELAAQRKALMDAAELAAIQKERAKFGG